MTFEEMKRLHDPFNCHSEYMTVKNAKILEYIPVTFHSVFQDNCECGSENIITSNLTRMTCCDPKCKIKQGLMLAEMMSRFGVKGLGTEKCKKIVDYLIDRTERQSYIEMLFYELKDLPPSLADYDIGRSFIQATYNILEEPLTFPKMISKLGIPGLEDEGCSKLFKGISNFEELIQEINKNGNVLNFCVNRGVYDKHKIFWLQNSLFTIGLAYRYFRQKIRLQGIQPLTISITGSINLRGVRITKDAFIDYCNSIAKTKDGIPLFEVSKSEAVNTNRFVVASNASGDRKYLVGKARQARVEHIRSMGHDVEDVLITPERLESIIRKEVSDWENEHQELIG